MRRRNRNSGKGKHSRLICPSGKTGFRSEPLALEFLGDINPDRSAVVPKRAYPCDLCPWWHVTSRDHW